MEQQGEMARAGGRTLAALQPEQVTEQYGLTCKACKRAASFTTRFYYTNGPLGTRIYSVRARSIIWIVACLKR